MNRHRILSHSCGLILLAACDAPAPIFSMDTLYSGRLSDGEIGSQVELVDEDSWLALALLTDEEGEASGELFFDGSIKVYGQAIFDYTGQAYEIIDLHIDERQLRGRVESPTSPPLKLRGVFEEETTTLVLNARGIGKLYLSEGSPFEAQEIEDELMH